MHKTYIILIFLLYTIMTYGQDSKFIWSMNTMGFSTQIQVENTGGKCYIQIENAHPASRFRKKIKNEDCYQLFDYLDSYEFKTLGNTYSYTTKTYYETEFLADSLRVVANGDTLRLELMPVKNYNYDKTLRKCYKEATYSGGWLDGTTYNGEYIKSSSAKKYSLYCTRLTLKDYEINHLVAELIKKYDKQFIFNKIVDNIESGKPIEKE